MNVAENRLQRSHIHGKRHGWRWGRSITAWYVPHSRDRLPKMPGIERTKNSRPQARPLELVVTLRQRRRSCLPVRF